MYGHAAGAGKGLDRTMGVATVAMAMLIHVMDKKRSRLPCSIAFQLAWSKAARSTTPPVRLNMWIAGKWMRDNPKGTDWQDIYLVTGRQTR